MVSWSIAEFLDPVALTVLIRVAPRWDAVELVERFLEPCGPVLNSLLVSELVDLHGVDLKIPEADIILLAAIEGAGERLLATVGSHVVDVQKIRAREYLV